MSMHRLASGLLLLAIAPITLAAGFAAVPEVDASSAAAAIAVLVGAVLLAVERRRKAARKSPVRRDDERAR